MKPTTGSHKFKLYREGLPRAPLSGSGILLYPFRGISVQGFSYPFSGISQIREALRIRFRPLLGDASERVSIVPFLVSSEKKSSTGCVFLLFGEEIDTAETDIGVDAALQIWPDALAFAGEVDGTGLIIVTGEDFITTVWLDEWTPRFYKTVPAGESTEDAEEKLAVQYASGQGKEVEKVFSVNLAGVTDSDAQEYGSKTLARCPAYEQLDLSRRGASILEKRERIVGALSRAARFAAAVGAVVLLAAGGVYAYNSSVAGAANSDMEAIYSASFGETSSQPLRSINEKLRSLNGQEGETTLYDMLRGVSSVWDKIGTSADVYIETLRFGTENTNIIGTAKSNEAIRNLQRLIENEGLSARTDNINTISAGGDLRFSLNISRGNQ
ncbi:MAG: hypothetical protein LBI74_03375 [Synergistaceae bacterium]|jgi:hypothetical protein|nr:hypothetical protein [Synergistaceae bacterium]